MRKVEVRAILAGAQQGAEEDNQNLIKVVTDILLAWVEYLAETGDGLFHAVAPQSNPTLKSDQPLRRKPKVAEMGHMRSPWVSRKPSFAAIRPDCHLATLIFHYGIITEPHKQPNRLWCRPRVMTSYQIGAFSPGAPIWR